MSEPKSAVARKDKLILGAGILAFAAAGVTSRIQVGPVVAFLFAAVALSLLAVAVGEATDNLGSRLSPGATGALQSALGNLPELFVCIFALRAGLVDVVKGALVGSILANSLLVLGLAMLLGGLKHGTQKFHSEPPKMMAKLMLLAVTAMVVPTLAQLLHTPAEQHMVSLSAACAVILLIVFASTLSFFIRGNAQVVVPQPVHATAWPMGFAVVVLAVAGVSSAFVSEWFVAALEPATKAMGISQAFSGLVVVAIAGNAIENLVGIQLMVKNKPDYAVSVVLNSSLQIALVLVPVLVLLSFFVGAAPMTLVLNPLLVASLLIAVIVQAFVVYDGESIWLEGVALLGLYALLVSAFWWG